MDGRVENLDVIDFPGVDDKESVPELAKLLVGLAQIVLFIVSYRYTTKCPVRQTYFVALHVCLLSQKHWQ